MKTVSDHAPDAYDHLLDPNAGELVQGTGNVELVLEGNRDAGGDTVPKGNDSDRHVVPDPDGGWKVVKENHKRASVHASTKKEAVDRAREIVRNQGGGEIRIHGKDGKLIDSDTVRGPKRGESSARDRK